MTESGFLYLLLAIGLFGTLPAALDGHISWSVALSPVGAIGVYLLFVVIVGWRS